MDTLEKTRPTDAAITALTIEELAMTLQAAKDEGADRIELFVDSETAKNILHLWKQVQDHNAQVLS